MRPITKIRLDQMCDAAFKIPDRETRHQFLIQGMVDVLSLAPDSDIEEELFASADIYAKMHKDDPSKGLMLTILETLEGMLALRQIMRSE